MQTSTTCSRRLSLDHRPPTARLTNGRSSFLLYDSSSDDKRMLYTAVAHKFTVVGGFGVSWGIAPFGGSSFASFSFMVLGFGFFGSSGLERFLFSRKLYRPKRPWRRKIVIKENQKTIRLLSKNAHLLPGSRDVGMMMTIK